MDSLGLSRPIPQSEFPPEEWFSIASTVADENASKFTAVGAC